MKIAPTGLLSDPPFSFFLENQKEDYVSLIARGTLKLLTRSRDIPHRPCVSMQRLVQLGCRSQLTWVCKPTLSSAASRKSCPSGKISGRLTLPHYCRGPRSTQKEELPKYFSLLTT